MNTTWTVLGCRAGAPAGGVAASGYVLQAGGQTLLIDCGPGIALEVTRQEWLNPLDGIIISHAHADHCADLLPLAYQRRFPELRPVLPVWGPAGVAQVMAGLDSIFGIPSLPALATPLTSAFAFTAVQPGTVFSSGALTIETLRTQHPTPTMALRFPGLGIVYTADGAMTDALVAFARGARLLIAEATYLTGEGRDLAGHGHLTGVLAGQLAQKAGVQELLLTHFADMALADATRSAAAAYFEGNIHLAHPGLPIVI
jgi:ribonuclease BN (tRNA processing enzyme)